MTDSSVRYPSFRFTRTKGGMARDHVTPFIVGATRGTVVGAEQGSETRPTLLSK